MNMDTKIILSEQELQLAYNKEWILTKQKITSAVYQLFGNLSGSVKQELSNAADWLPEEVITTLPKIHKGENYLNLPYVMLDSTTLLLEGKYKRNYQSVIIQNLLEKDADLYICLSEDKWQHHFNKSNYCSVKNIALDQIEKMIADKEFIKIAIQYPLHKWHSMPVLLKADIKKLLALLKN